MKYTITINQYALSLMSLRATKRSKASSDLFVIASPIQEGEAISSLLYVRLLHFVRSDMWIEL